jgi:hypothetical protein
LTMRQIRTEWWDDQAVSWLSWGILNPFGPTLNILGMKRDGSQHRSFLRALHFTGGSTIEGDVFDGPKTLQDIIHEAGKIDKFLAGSGDGRLFSTIPSFVISRQDDEALKQVFAQLLLECGGLDLDWGKELQAVSEFGTKFWDRATFEMNAALQAGSAQPATTGIPSADDFKWWLETVSSDAFSRSAFQNFIMMWQGASGQAPGMVKVTELEVLQFLLKTDLLTARFLPKSLN